MKQVQIQFNLNGTDLVLSVLPLRRLIDVLRDDLKLTGTKEGCSEGECGACVIIMDGLLYNACILPVEMIRGKNLLTIEGFRTTDQFEILKNAFDIEGSVQCGFCTPGMLMAAHALLTKNANPTREEVRTFMSGNLCRCTGYEMITNAILRASKAGEGLW